MGNSIRHLPCRLETSSILAGNLRDQKDLFLCIQIDCLLTPVTALSDNLLPLSKMPSAPSNDIQDPYVPDGVRYNVPTYYDPRLPVVYQVLTHPLIPVELHPSINGIFVLLWQERPPVDILDSSGLILPGAY